MSAKNNKNQEAIANHIWQRNLNNARDIHINLENSLDESFKLLLDVINNFKKINDTDPDGLLLSLLTSVGHFSGQSIVKITKHISNLNLFLLLIGPSGILIYKICIYIKTHFNRQW
jgi:hypothetical protein